MDVIRYNICEHFRCTHCCNICEREGLKGLTKENKMVPQPVIRSFPYDIPDDGKFIPQVGDVIERTNKASGTVTRGTVQRTTGMTAIDSTGVLLYRGSTLNDPDYQYSYRLLKRVRKYEVGTLISGNEAGSLPVGTILTKVWQAPFYDVVILGTERHNGTPFRSNRYRRIDTVLSWNSISGEWRIKYIPEVN